MHGRDCWGLQSFGSKRKLGKEALDFCGEHETPLASCKCCYLRGKTVRFDL
jgi:hypothetical protein